MKIKTYQYSSIKDSSLLYKKKVPPYIFILIGLVLAILIGTVIWANFSIKANVVKQGGIIVAKDKVNLNCSVNSTITKINFKEGEQVKAGESIIEFSTNEIVANVIQAKQLYETYKFNEESFNKLIDYIENDYAIDEPGKCFDPTNHSELQFYNYQLSFILNYGSLTGDALKQAKAQYFNQTIIPLRDDAKSKKEQYQAQYDAYNKIKETYTLKATTDGYLHFNYPLNEGMFISYGSSLISISPNKDDLICEVYFTSSDYSKLQVGNEVRAALAGVSQNDYGTLKGELVSLSDDVTTTEDGSFIRGEVKFESNSLTSKNNEIKLAIGMQVEVRVVYEETTYLNWVLEKLGLKKK